METKKGVVMQVYHEPAREEWESLCRRPIMDGAKLGEVLDEVFVSVKKDGDMALIAYTKRFDGVDLASIGVPLADAKKEGSYLDADLREAIDVAYRNINTFHRSQVAGDVLKIETQPGVVCWRKSTPIDTVGLYIPGGSAPLISTTLMLGIPAQIAGCQEVVVVTPPMADGSVHPAIRYAAAKIGARTIYRVGGAQAVAALTFGTESVPRVDKVFGPGNQYVTGAKERAVRYGLAIDMPAGPSEVLVMADSTTDPAFAAADLLSQAEHGQDSQVVLVADQETTVKAIQREVQKQVAVLPRRKIAEGALTHSFCVVIDDAQRAMDFVNAYAPEHVIISTSDCHERVPKVKNAGSVFIGVYTPESAGDYASGTNHTLPTSAWARSYGGVAVDSFCKYITYQEITQQGIKDLSQAITVLAEAEGLAAHARAVTIRL